MTLLTLDGLNVTLGRTPILTGVSLEVHPGEFIGLIGPNGAGKSTLLRAALGLTPATGRRRLGDRSIDSLSPAERAGRVSYVAQDREIAWPVTVDRIVTLGRDLYRNPGRRLTGQDQAAIDDAIERMDIGHLRDRSATSLSGGERARVLIARALAQDAPLMLADEPTAGLDPAHQIALMERLRALADAGRGLVMSLHDLGLAARWCSRLVLIDAGRIVADGTPAQVLTDEALATVYGVRAHRDHAAGGMIVQPITLLRRSPPAADGSDALVG